MSAPEYLTVQGLGGFRVSVIEDTIASSGRRLTTLLLRYWRGIHSELMTHRAFSRNAQSSRAMPVDAMLRQVKEDPFIPWYWGKNQKGMQASETIDHVGAAEEEWLTARDSVVGSVRSLQDLSVHKQLANRLLEPWSYIHTLVTATEWENHDNLRAHSAAQPEYQELARLMVEARNQSRPRPLFGEGDWHLPFVLPVERKLYRLSVQKKLSVARCARTSYARFDGEPNAEHDVERHDALLKEGHMSPFEHQATPSDNYPRVFIGNFRGFRQYRKEIDGENVFRPQIADAALGTYKESLVPSRPLSE